MKPIYQTKFGLEGNCWQAAVASLLDLPLDEVPDFVHERWPEMKSGQGLEKEDGISVNPFWWQDFTAWLTARGLRAVTIWSPAVHYITPLPDYYHIKSGLSPRGLEHSVIGLGEQIVHDPHPDDTGLVRVDDIAFIIPSDR